MKNRLKLAAAVLSAAFAFSGITAFAQSGEPAGPMQPPKETVIEDNHTLTPDGNAQLMDDVTDNENLQFITVAARDGSEFYIIIDKGAQNENVYFLNTVDESDLAALVEDYAPEQTTEQQQPEVNRHAGHRTGTAGTGTTRAARTGGGTVKQQLSIFDCSCCYRWRGAGYLLFQGVPSQKETGTGRRSGGL